MLYVSTRNDRDPQTPHRILRNSRCPEGGLYLPFRHPRFSEEEIGVWLKMSFGQCVAEVLNRFLNTDLTGWDIDFSCGRSPVRLRELGYKLLIAEGWHTRNGQFRQIAETVTERICGENTEPSDWMNILVRASVWFGVFAELKRRGIDRADISVAAGDFSLPISAWYARHWGLPIGRILCCCNESHAVWELLTHGQMRTDTPAVPVWIPEGDGSVPAALERLIYEAGGTGETARYLDACRRGVIYYPDDSALEIMRQGLYATVVSSGRVTETIPSVRRSHGYGMAPETALAYAGLLDHRSQSGNIGTTVIWAERAPVAEDPADNNQYD